jgi:hypothetical protein
MSDPARPVEPTIDLASMDDVPDLARLRWELYVEQEGAREELGAYTDRFVGFALQALGSDRWRAWVARGTSGPVAAMWLQTGPGPGQARGSDRVPHQRLRTPGAA